MPTPRFLQIHTLMSYPAVLLNRDDAGLAKRISYGGKVRTRVSSQCLKRHWRTAEDAWDLSHVGAERATRSREAFEYAIRPEVKKALPALPDAVLDEAGKALSRALYGDKADDVSKRQALLLGYPELRYLTGQFIDLVREATDGKHAADAVTAHFKGKEAKANLTILKGSAGTPAAGLEAALFGRMITSDPAANTDAALHVAHAFTVHEQESETDYFTVVDDLKQAAADSDSGSAGIFDTELTSGLFYSYVVVDVAALVSNLTGCPPQDWAKAAIDRSLPGRVVEHLLHLIATVSPGAKKGSTAPYAYAQMLLVEAGDRQPRSLAAAFEKPVRPPADIGLTAAAEEALFAYLGGCDKAYGPQEARRFLSLNPTPRPHADGPHALDSLAAWAAGLITAAQA